jgi:hypothetical protein
MPILTETGATVLAEDDRPKRPGLYLAVLHGRSTVASQMNGWGSAGPLLGPLEYVHTTYSVTIRIKFVSKKVEAAFFEDPAFPEPQDLTVSKGMLLYNGMYYGDWTVLYVPAEDCEDFQLPCDTFRSVARR